MDSTTILVLVILGLATLIRSAFGFGEALVAVPLLALLIPIEVAAPVAVLASITVAALILAQDWRHVHLGGTLRLVLSTFAGIPFGLLLLKTAPEPLVKALLGLVIITFATYRLLGPEGRQLQTDRLAWAFGFVAGVLGGAYGMNGPPLAIYGALRRWTREQFRATLQGYFFPASLVGMAGYWLAGLWVPKVTHYFVVSIPVIIVGTLLGRLLSRRLDARQFMLCIHVGLIIIGAILLTQSVWHPTAP